MARRSSTNGTRGWDALPAAEQAAKKARQGVRYVPLEALDVLDPDTHGAGAARRRDASAR